MEYTNLSDYGSQSDWDMVMEEVDPLSWLGTLLSVTQPNEHTLLSVTQPNEPLCNTVTETPSRLSVLVLHGTFNTHLLRLHLES